MKYQSSSTDCSKFISKVTVFKKWVKLQGQGHRVKNNGTHVKVLSQGKFKWNIKALALTVQKLLTRLKFQKGQNDRPDKNNMPPDMRSRWCNNNLQTNSTNTVKYETNIDFIVKCAMISSPEHWHSVLFPGGVFKVKLFLYNSWFLVIYMIVLVSIAYHMQALTQLWVQLRRIIFVRFEYTSASQKYWPNT